MAAFEWIVRACRVSTVTATKPVAALVHEDRVEMDRPAYPAQVDAPPWMLYALLVIKDQNNRAPSCTSRTWA